MQLFLGALETCGVTVLNMENWKKPIDLLFLPVVLLSQSPSELKKVRAFPLATTLFVCPGKLRSESKC